MIRLTRLRNPNPLYINPDHIERLDQFHDTTVHLFNGDEFVVTESAEQIVEQIVQQRARILSIASRLARASADDEPDTAGVAKVSGTSMSAIIALDEADADGED
jgi:uncharacterized protein YlzI (FlbEa/FlbD family)